MFEIIPAKLPDLKAVQNCARAAYSHYIERIGREPAPMVADFATAINRGSLYLAKPDGVVAGFVIFYPGEEHIHLENVAVSPDFQGRGLGLQLIEYAEQAARESGFPRVELYTNAKMTENLGLYPRLGYQQFDRRIEDGFDRVYFSKEIK